MADLPQARVCLRKEKPRSGPVDRLSPHPVTLRRRRQNKVGHIFKCMTTQEEHINLLPLTWTPS